MNEIDLVRLVLSAHQQAYAKFHCEEKRPVIEADGMAIGYASVELAKALAARAADAAELERKATNAAYRTWNDLASLVNFISGELTKDKAIAAIKLRFLEQFEDLGVNQQAAPASPAPTANDEELKRLREEGWETQ